MREFFDAIKSNDLDTVSLLITGAKDVDMLVNQTIINGCTPLLIAARYGRAEVVQLLLKRDADVNQAGDNGCAPLSIAAEEGHAKVKLVGQSPTSPLRD